MPPILIVGNAVLDLILEVNHYPAEDEEMRAASRRLELGGNAANTARVLAGLGHEVTLLNTLAPDEDAVTVRRLLYEAGVDTRYLVTAPQGQTPYSHILLNRSNGSRTIVHHRELAELAFEDFTALPLHSYDWIHFEGRNVVELKRMLEHLSGIGWAGRISLEIEKDRPGITALMAPATLVLFSRAWAASRGYPDAPGLLADMRGLAPGPALTCSWGDHGAWAMDTEEDIFHCPAFAPYRVVDTVGAGDVFNAGMIDALMAGNPLDRALTAAVRLAAKKVGHVGFNGLFPSPRTE